MISSNQVHIMPWFCTERSRYALLPVICIATSQRSHKINVTFLLTRIRPTQIGVKYLDSNLEAYYRCHLGHRLRTTTV